MKESKLVDALACGTCDGSVEVAVRACLHVGECDCGRVKGGPCPECVDGREACEHCLHDAHIREGLYSGRPSCLDCESITQGELGWAL